jgi:ParB-like chromosome segregation protein Spo0J
VRKVKIEYIDINRLKEWENNPRINDEASKKLSKLIKYYGFINPIICTPDGVIRAGHTRYKAAKLNKLKKVPVIFIDFKSEEEAKGYSISDNKSYEFSKWDVVLLKDELEELDTGEFDIELTGFSEGEIENLMTQYHVPVTLEDIGKKLESYIKAGPHRCIVISFGKFVSPVKKDEDIDEMEFIQRSEEVMNLEDEERRIIALEVAKFIYERVKKWLNLP